MVGIHNVDVISSYINLIYQVQKPGSYHTDVVWSFLVVSFWKLRLCVTEIVQGYFAFLVKLNFFSRYFDSHDFSKINIIIKTNK